MNDDSFENLKLDRQLCFLLYASSKSMIQAYKPLLSKLNLTYPQYLVMMVLWEEDYISLKHLGQRLYLDSGTLTPMLKRMQTQGLITRERHAQDEREIQICLTQSGAELKEKAKDIPTDLNCDLGLDLDFIVDLKDKLDIFFERIIKKE